MITKWRLSNKSFVESGSLGRTEALTAGACFVEMVAIGTIATSWQEVDKLVNHYNGDKEIIGSHNERRVLKHETVFVDRIEYRLMLNNELWSEWMIPGNTMAH